MKRRDFVYRAVLTGGALSLGIGCKRKIEPAAGTGDSPVILPDKKEGRIIRYTELHRVKKLDLCGYQCLSV